MTKAARLWMGMLAAALLLAGCGGGLGSFRKPVQTVTVADRSVVIGGAPGYCVDRAASRLGGDSPFVLLGSCASITGKPGSDVPAQPGILTATVSGTGSGVGFAETLPQLESFVTSPAGRAGLARDGNAASVKVLTSRTEGAALFVRLRDSSANSVPGVAPAYWRGLFEVAGRLVTVSVMEFQDQPLGSDASLQALRYFIARIRRETAALHAG